MITLKWQTLLLGIAIVVFLTLFIQKSIRWVFKHARYKASFIKPYWQFSIIFAVVGVIVYLLVFWLSPESTIDVAINVTNTSLTLVFAIFVGYYAFMQVAENRVEKYKEEVQLHIHNRDYIRAALICEKVYKINPKDFWALSNLLEIRLITGEDEWFLAHIEELHDTVKEHWEQVAYYYLKIIRDLFKQHISETQASIKLLLEYIRKNPDSLERNKWAYRDVKMCDCFKQLTGDSKKIIENVIRYLERGMNDDEKKYFSDGDYTLEKYKLDQEQKRQETAKKKDVVSQATGSK